MRLVITRFAGSVIYHAYSRAIQSARKSLASDLAKFVKHMHVCYTQVSSLNRAVL